MNGVASSGKLCHWTVPKLTQANIWRLDTQQSARKENSTSARKVIMGRCLWRLHSRSRSRNWITVISIDRDHCNRLLTIEITVNRLERKPRISSMQDSIAVVYRPDYCNANSSRAQELQVAVHHVGEDDTFHSNTALFTLFFPDPKNDA